MAGQRDFAVALRQHRFFDQRSEHRRKGRRRQREAAFQLLARHTGTQGITGVIVGEGAGSPL